MKIYGLVLVSMMLCVTGFSQVNLDSLMMHRTLTCEDIGYNCTDLIMTYYSHERYDSVDIVLNYWERKCGSSEPIMRTRILNAIAQKAFSEQIYDSTIIDQLIEFTYRCGSWEYKEVDGYLSYWDYVLPGGGYDRFLQNTALEQLPLQAENSIEQLFCSFYARVTENPYKVLQIDRNYSKTLLFRYYYQEVSAYLQMNEFSVDVMTGIWIPQENAALLGNHPIIGFRIGKNRKKFNGHFSMNFKFLESKNPYQIYNNGTFDTCTYFFGGYFGYDFDIKLFDYQKHRIDLSGGIGYDGFDAVNTNLTDQNTDNDEPYSIGSLDANFGMGYTYRFGTGSYISIQGKYHLVDYSNPAGTNLKGNLITLSLYVGQLINPIKYEGLRRLRYIGGI